MSDARNLPNSYTREIAEGRARHLSGRHLGELVVVVRVDTSLGPEFDACLATDARVWYPGVPYDGTWQDGWPTASAAR